jgi:AcrR family transcriptional regulator
MSLTTTKTQRQKSDVGGARLSIREEQKEMTRNRLLDAAMGVFTKVGFRIATIDDIMKRAGANRATFYLHFKDKIDLAAGLGRRMEPATTQRLKMLDNLAEPTLAEIRAWLENEFRASKETRVMLHVMHEAITSDPRFGAQYLSYLGRIADRTMVRTLSRWPEERRDIIRSKIVCLLIMLQRVEFNLNCQELDFGDRPYFDAIAELLWAELFAVEPTSRNAQDRPSTP